MRTPIWIPAVAATAALLLTPTLAGATLVLVPSASVASRMSLPGKKRLTDYADCAG